MRNVHKAKLWNRRNSLIVTLPLAAITLLYLVQVYLPLRRTITDLRQQCQHHEMMLRHVHSLGASIAGKQNELRETEEFANRHNQKLPSTQAAIDSLGEIALLAGQAGARMERFEPAPADDMEFLSRVPVSLSCTGDFAKLFDFLSRLESQPRRMWIEELRFEGAREAGKPARCELKLVVFAKGSGNSD